MAGAEIIASAIGILCLIIFGYVLVGGILTTGENTIATQKDYVLMKESQREIDQQETVGTVPPWGIVTPGITAIDIPHSSPRPAFSCVDDSWTFIFTWNWKKCSLTFNITNTGTEMIGDFNQTDISVNVSENIIRGPGFWPYDMIIPANDWIPLKFNPTAVGIGGDQPSGNWSYIQISPDISHPGMLDPNEKMKVQINNFRFLNQPAHFMINVTTPNGVTDTYSQ